MSHDPASMDLHGFEIPAQVGPGHGRRRITAESFRLLTARLKAKPVPEVLPVFTPEQPMQPGLLWPESDFAMPAVISGTVIAGPDPEIAGPEPLSPPAIDTAPGEDVVLSAFVPLWPMEEAARPDPSFGIDSHAAEKIHEAPEVPVASPEIEPETVAAGPAPDIAEADTLPVFDSPAQIPEPRPLSDPVEDAILQAVTEAVYAKPSSAERAAFLRDVAPVIEEEVSTASLDPGEPPFEEPEDLPATLADKLGPSAALLRKLPEASDPFSQTAQDAIRLAPKPAETADAGLDAGELALSLLDMMSAGSSSGLPQERALAADTLLRMIPRVPVKQLIMVGERVAIMETPPSLLVAKLIRDPRAEVVAPLLERCMHITDQDLITAASEGDSTKRRMIARRRILSPVLADHLILIGDPSTLLTLIRNPGASFSHEAFYRLADHASEHHALLAPLTTRADLPAPVAFELFWFVPQELRRFIFSRFLTDSETLTKILKITLGAQEGGETKFPPREFLEAAIDKTAQGQLDDAAQSLAEIGGISQEAALRILADPNGEPVTVLLKALGFTRAKFAGAMEGLQRAPCQTLRPDRNISELETLFDTLSFNKARILLTYWDWFVQKSGPYAPHN